MKGIYFLDESQGDTQCCWFLRRAEPQFWGNNTFQPSLFCYQTQKDYLVS